MPLRSDFLRRLDLAHPIIQAPLAGGGDTPALVAAVSQAGALGFIGAAYLTPERIAETARDVRARTRRPFGINLFAPGPEPQAVDPTAALACVAPYYRELGLPAPAAPQADTYRVDDQLAAALDSGAAIFSFTLGRLPEATIRRIKAAGMMVMGTASTVEEARLIEADGADAVVLQGAEAGGHRCTFAGGFEAGLIGTLALVPQAADALRIPVIASGGIMDGRGIVAALALGASAVQMGTAFLTAAEAGVPDVYKDALLAAGEADTRVTRAFSGRPARGLVNRFMREVDAEAHETPEVILPFPRQNALSRPMRAAAAAAGRAEFLSLWAGQGVGLARRDTARGLVERLASETTWTVARLNSTTSEALRVDVDDQARRDRAQAMAAAVRRTLARLARLVSRFAAATAEGVRMGRDCPSPGDVGTDGARLARWVAARQQTHPLR